MNARFLLVAILLAGLSAALVYAKISAGGGTSTKSSSGGDQQVVVAKSDIKENVPIVAAMLEVKSVPLSAASTNTFKTVDSVIGKVTKFPIAQNQQVLSTAVVDITTPGAAGVATLKNVVPVGKRGVSVQASQVSQAGGLILPGDFVDVVWTCCQDKAVATKTLLKNVQVAAIAQTLIPSGPASGSKPAAGSTPVTSTNPVAAGASVAVPDAVTATLLLDPGPSHDSKDSPDQLRTASGLRLCDGTRSHQGRGRESTARSGPGH